MSATPDVSVIIPFLNEADNIPDLARELGEMAAGNPDIRLEFVFVDDGSTDASVSLLQQNISEELNWKIIKLSRNYGSYNALRVGVVHASAPIASFLYADLQDPVNLIPRMYKRMQAGNNIVIAEREATHNRFSERFFSEIHARIVRRFVAESFPLKGFDVVMFDEKVKAKLNDNIEADSNIFLQILRSGFKQEFISYEKLERTKGVSKWSFGAKIKASLDILVGFSYLPVKLISLAGILMFVSGSILLLIWLILLILGEVSHHAPWLLASILLIALGITNISLWLLGEYLWRILNAARKRPVFTVDQVIEKDEQIPS